MAYVGKTCCDRLFELERQFSVLSSEDRFAKRQELAKPVLDEFLLWLQKQITGKSALGNAIHYTLEQWKYLKRYLLDGRLEISNNRAERSIKPFVIGRKSFLFCNVPKGAESSAVLYSIVETAKENRLNPYEYLSFLLRELSSNPQIDLERLLPGGSSIPQTCLCPKPKTESFPWEDSPV